MTTPGRSRRSAPHAATGQDLWGEVVAEKGTIADPSHQWSQEAEDFTAERPMAPDSSTDVDHGWIWLNAERSAGDLRDKPLNRGEKAA